MIKITYEPFKKVVIKSMYALKKLRTLFTSLRSSGLVGPPFPLTGLMAWCLFTVL